MSQGSGTGKNRKDIPLATNYSLLKPEIDIRIVEGDDRYERALQLLEGCGNDFSVSNAFTVLRAVRQEGIWATRVSFVYSANEQTVYYAENNHFENIKKFTFQREEL